MDGFLLRWEERLAMLFFGITSLFVFMGAVGRVVGFPLIWSVELAQLAFAWVCVLGADIALKKNAHIEIDILVRFFPAGVRKALALIWQIAIACFLAALIWFGVKLTMLNTERELGVLTVSYSWVTGAIPAGAALMLITVLSRLWRVITGKESLSLEGRDGTAI